MNSRAFRNFLLTIVSVASAQAPNPHKVEQAQDLQTAYCPNIHRLEVAPSQKSFLAGTIGHRHVRMYLDRGGSGVVGLFFDEANWQVTEFGGTWNNGQIDGSDKTENRPATGHLSASLSGNGLIGSWTQENSRQADPIELTTTPEPACDGKEPWNRVDDPKSLISFAYPASWRLERDRDGTWLTCPDPSEIAYSHGVLIKMGSGAFQDPPELLECSDRWIYGTSDSKCDCVQHDKTGCHTAEATRNGSATVLDVGDHEWRTYCLDSGYVGQGEGEDRIILLPHSWVEIMATGKSSALIDRLVDSVKESQPAEEK